MLKSRSLSLLFGAGSLVAAASAGRAATTTTTLFDSAGFEPSAGYVAGPLGQNLAGQPAAASANNQFVGNVSTPAAANSITPFGAVETYSPTSPTSTTNTQYVALGGSGLTTPDFGYFYPQTNVTTPFTPTAATGMQIAVRWTMSVTTATNHPFFGIVAFNGDNTVAVAGIDGTTGGVYDGLAAGATRSGFVATTGTATFFQYELLLDYRTQSYSFFEAPIVGNVSGSFTQIGSSPFLSAATQFTDADMAMFVVPNTTAAGTTSAGLAQFDNYSVQTLPVPEPASLALVCGIGLVGLGGRRKR